MKKQKMIILSAACILVLGIVAAAFAVGSGKKPYKDLDASGIMSAKVRLSPPDKTIQITDINRLAEYLRDVVIYHEDNSYTESAGQGVTFMLTMTDGTQTEIMAYNPFLVIDGVGYQTEYAPCEALDNYANGLLNAKDANIILEEPPALAVVSDQTSVGALSGSYSWQKTNPDGTVTAMQADSAHPLDCKDSFTLLETSEMTARLQFTQRPDTILFVRCWSDAHWADTGADSEDVTVNGTVIDLKPGSYIYEVGAEWDTANGYGGTAYYSFYIQTIE